MSSIALNRYLDPLMPFLKAEGVTELCINRPNELYVERFGVFRSYELPILTYDYLHSLSSLLAEFNQKDYPAPLLFGSLPTGERVQVVMDPACEKDKIVFSIRKPYSTSLSLDDYEKKGVFDVTRGSLHADHNENSLQAYYVTKNYSAFLREAVSQKKNILISGGTGTGKTTFLNACLDLIPDNERILTVEDTREVRVRHKNSSHLLFNENNEKITALNIFKTCLRLRPDRIFLSELRGNEVWPYLRAANSGHPGSMTTVHADNPEGAFTQLVFMMQQAGSTSSEEQIRSYIKSIIHVVVQLKKHSDKSKFMYVDEINYQHGNSLIH